MVTDVNVKMVSRVMVFRVVTSTSVWKVAVIAMITLTVSITTAAMNVSVTPDSFILSVVASILTNAFSIHAVHMLHVRIPLVPFHVHVMMVSAELDTLESQPMKSLPTDVLMLTNVKDLTLVQAIVHVSILLDRILASVIPGFLSMKMVNVTILTNAMQLYLHALFIQRVTIMMVHTLVNVMMDISKSIMRVWTSMNVKIQTSAVITLLAVTSMVGSIVSAAQDITLILRMRNAVISMNVKLMVINAVTMPIVLTMMAPILAPAKTVTLEMVSVAPIKMNALLRVRMIVTRTLFVKTTMVVIPVNVIMDIKVMDLHARTSMNVKETINAQNIPDASMPLVRIAVSVILVLPMMVVVDVLI